MEQNPNEEHKKNSNESVEQNLSPDYIPKSKLKDLPLTNQIEKAINDKKEKTQKDIEKFKNEINKKYKFIESLGIIPPQASKIIEEEFEISQEDSKRELIHLLIIIPEKQFKNIANIRLESIKISRKINEKIWVHILSQIDIWNLGLDSKFDVFEALAMSYPLQDKGFLGAIRVAQIHKSLVLKKFEKYVTSYVMYGSITRGETVKTSDVDIGIIIDDTDVKKMPRLELKEKLRGIIYSYIQEAEAISGVRNKLSPQVWLLTEFWDGVKDAHPVFFTFIRDGVSLYDRGTFLPWKSLLRMGKIRPSTEAIDMFMSSGDKLKETIQKRIFDIATLDLFWGVSTPTQGLLMLYGLAPGNVYDTVKAFREIFYEKEKIVEKKYVDILEEILIKVWKAHEHSKIKPGDIDGKELDRLSKDALDYIDRLKKLREKIEARIQEKSIKENYEEVFDMLKAILKKNTEKEIITQFQKEFIKSGKLSARMLENLKFISKIKTELKNYNHNKTNLSSKQSKDVDKARKYATEIINALTEYNQRCNLIKLDRARFVINAKSSKAEIFFLKDVFIIQGPKIQKYKKGTLTKSSEEEFQKQLIDHQNKETHLDFNVLEDIKKMFGDYELIS